MLIDVKEKVAIITGGAKGIGAAIVKTLAAKGVKIAFTYLHSEEQAKKLEEELGENVKAYRCNQSNLEEVQTVFNQIIQDFSKVDFLINNAGITRDNLLLRMSEQQWDDVIQNNLKSVFNSTKCALKFMLKNGGSIIHISSIVGIKGNTGQSNYAASKAAIIGFSKSIAQEYGSKNIRSNVVAPGFIDTDMTSKITEEQKAMLFQNIPLKKFGNSDDVANTVLFLCSNMSNYVTGQTISVCGGLNL